MAKYQVGERVTGVINNITDLGIFVTLDARKLGLIHHSDWDGSWPSQRGRYRIGDEIRSVIVHVNKGKLGLSLARINDPDLIDPTNQYNQVKAADFAKVLNQTSAKAKKAISDLEQVLEEYR